MSYIKASGTIEAVARNQKNFKLKGDERWYGCYRQNQMNGAQRGDDVKFEYVEKDSNGTTFYNVQGNVNVVGSEGGGNSGGNRSSGQSSGGGGGRSAGVPVAKSDGLSKEEWAEKDRRIVRQNALSHATAILAVSLGQGQTDSQLETLAEEAIELAKMFESYVYGEQ